MSKQYMALARVSSREQEREGFSLEVQVEALHRYANDNDGQIVKMFRIAETATKPQERHTFKELMEYAKQHAPQLAGLLFFKVDRAARNLFDYVELERLEADYGLKVVYITQPTENTPAGRMMRRTLANMASFYTEQQSLDVRDGLRRRVQNGLFVNRPPYGYANRRIDGRSIVEIETVKAPRVRRIFELYAYHGHTLDALQAQLAQEGVYYTDSVPRFSRTKLHEILTDRSYIGDVMYRGQWHPGTHEPLIERLTWNQVQANLGGQQNKSHELVFASNLIECDHCGHAVTGEQKSKNTRAGKKTYTYYRCARYSSAAHPRVRVREEQLNNQVLSIFDTLRVPDENIRQWFGRVLQARTQQTRDDRQSEIAALTRQVTVLRQQQERLLNLRLLDEIDEQRFAAKNTKIRDQIAELSLKLEAYDRNEAGTRDLAVKAFELSQSLKDKWVTSDMRRKRQLLQIVCLNLSLEGATLVPTMRKPFDILAEGLVSNNNRDERI
jgi:site-specific DNA recombinase